MGGGKTQGGREERRKRGRGVAEPVGETRHGRKPEKKDGNEWMYTKTCLKTSQSQKVEGLKPLVRITFIYYLEGCNTFLKPFLRNLDMTLKVNQA